MIIVGTMGIPFTLNRGTFHCPTCRTDLPFRHRSLRRFLTIYFIPLIPLDRLGEYVECGQCKERFTPAVLTRNAADVSHDISLRIRNTLALLAAEDGQVTEDEIAAYQEVVRQITGEVLSAPEVQQDFRRGREVGQSTLAYLRAINEVLTREDKRQIVKAAFRMASAGGDISPERNTVFAQFPNALGMTPAEFKQSVAEAVAGD